ncbi:EAL domain, c-di-GMP-specific phosphodiesterase class I (or its enzymatically inactive variant) [Kosakonia arachidis]|uniref:EAL domain, c-di-GMP-specific phosphodiesterase class I (Or its enzymatically inactive variant) n=1 Tax=Kosakonia arachidis TaxID=551989 RepID=A0A1I7E9K0_9ENTR|nr:EAL domain-containing protein [Kosakonia arachidis]SFU20611.1 EAL domain, c-di-GMP-specific phosphodiesterase class I (or its enzymatically inactive variant) [Kosakonia arachidis]
MTQSSLCVEASLRDFYITPSSLRKAFRDKQLIPYIQPIVESHSKCVVGGEVLLRWLHPDFGYISPELFIPYVEKSSAINEITDYIFEYVGNSLKSHSDTLPRKMKFCFNISPKNLNNKNLLRSCAKFLETLDDIEPLIVLEITERDKIPDLGSFELVIKALQNNKVQISLDDFGTGYSNYYYIEIFNPDYLKIDKFFVNGIGEKINSQYIIKSIVSLARDVGCLTIAEGVEYAHQYSYLCHENIDYMQGYLFSQPMMINSFASLIIDRN